MATARALLGWYWGRRARIAAFFGRRQLALECWERLWTLRPRDPAVIEAIAHLRASGGERTQAASLFEYALAIDAARRDTWFNLGYLRQEGGAHETALLAFERALALDGTHDRAWYGKGLSLVKLGRLDDAVIAFGCNVQLQPMSPYGWYQLTHALHRLGRHAEAGDAMRRLAHFEPQVARQLERETGIEIGVVVPF